MPTTSYTSFTHSTAALGGRTNAAGAAVGDYTAEEARMLVTTLLTEGKMTADSFVVAAQGPAAMAVDVGSGVAKADHYVVAGEDAGQGNYMVRGDVGTTAVTVPAAHASLVRIDEVYLVVRDTTYDGSTLVLPQLGYRQGDAGGGNPGEDATWDAAVLLARITVGAAVTTIVAGNISDQRSVSGFPAFLHSTGATLLADLLVFHSIILNTDLALTATYAEAIPIAVTVPANWTTATVYILAVTTGQLTSGSVLGFNVRTTFDGTVNAEWLTLAGGVPSGSLTSVAFDRKTGVTPGAKTGTVEAQSTSGVVDLTVRRLFLVAVRTA